MFVVSFKPLPEKFGKYKLDLRHVYVLGVISCEQCGWNSRAVKLPKKGWGTLGQNSYTALSVFRSAQMHKCGVAKRKREKQ